MAAGRKRDKRMKSIAKVKEQIHKLINKEIQKTQQEIAEFERKMQENAQVYGFGGKYTQFEKAKKRREEYLEELNALQKTQDRSVILTEISFTPYSCPTCRQKILMGDYGEKVHCPVCDRPIYKSAQREYMNIEAGSRAYVGRYGVTRLTDNGYIKG